ncbi:hypothetical protein [Maritalea porphyrae]|uniref:Uncharacterized protein n=1 Tax=Maritalea porphyrae TaxID=880732 RepID=A0ABQ5UPY7_9HYPH|nr:hypothetical protein [Maritalea porphyrae]GLQ16712.1 hypothetical protein GCM10007879_09610 [Maritalea porphyrae]
MVEFKRPRITADGQKLFYLSDYDSSNPRFRLADPQNILIQLKLYKWCMSDKYHSPVVKDKLVRSLFGQIAPDITTNAVGRVMAKLVTYKPHKQINKTEGGFVRIKMHWRFFHQLDMRFGLEYLIYLWLPKLMAMEGDSVETWDEFEEELEIIIHASDDDLMTNYVRPSIQRQLSFYQF